MPVQAPVVVTKSAVTLADHLDLRNLPVATTPAGKSFAIKTLHPADHEIKAVRGPGGLVPSVALSADMVDTIPFPAGATGAYIVQTPNIFIPMSLVFVDANENYVDHYVWTNPAFGGKLWHAPASWNLMMAPWHQVVDKIQKHRVNAQSITVEVIAPAVADQGTIVSAQAEISPFTCSTTTSNINANTDDVSITQRTDVWFYNLPPNANNMLMGTAAYTSKAKEGVYQPLKIGSFKWKNTNDPVFFLQDASGQKYSTSYNNAGFGNFPIWFNGLAFKGDAVPMPKPSSQAVGMTWIEGTAGNPQVSIRVRARQICEIVPSVGDQFSPMAEAPYPPDDLCYRMVREISARMKDAYPASYNDLGALKNVITKIGQGILKYADPVLDVVSLIPGVGNVTQGLRTGVNIAKGVAQLANSAGGNQSGPVAKQAVPLMRQSAGAGARMQLQGLPQRRNGKPKPRTRRQRK